MFSPPIPPEIQDVLDCFLNGNLPDSEVDAFLDAMEEYPELKTWLAHQFQIDYDLKILGKSESQPLQEYFARLRRHTLRDGGMFDGSRSFNEALKSTLEGSDEADPVANIPDMFVGPVPNDDSNVVRAEPGGKKTRLFSPLTTSALVVLLLVSLLCATSFRQVKIKGFIPVEGVVHYDDLPLANATICLQPENPEQRAAIGSSDASGKFNLWTLNPGDGVLPGNYKVSITKRMIMNPMTIREQRDYLDKHDLSPEIISKSEIPEKYSSTATSGLMVVVSKKGSRELEFNLMP